MSIYFTALFVLLVVQMASIFALVMPLHYQIRKRITETGTKFFENGQVRTVLVIEMVLVLLLFVDSWKRAHIPVLSHTQASIKQDVASSLQVLTSRAYNQRNVYISGFILYFNLCIPVLLNLLSRLVKYETLIRELKAKPEGTEEEYAADLLELKEALKSKETSLQALKTQVDNLNTQFDAQNAEKEPTKTTDKKNQ